MHLMDEQQPRQKVLGLWTDSGNNGEETLRGRKKLRVAQRRMEKERMEKLRERKVAAEGYEVGDASNDPLVQSSGGEEEP
nr:hypothetical protein Iba_scaffold1393CG0070 [Ipomoea batatas]